MIEVVAQAIDKAPRHFLRTNKTFTPRRYEIVNADTVDLIVVAWDTNYETAQCLQHEADSRERARAAITALRVPTDEMMLAAEDAVPALACFATREESPSFIAWQAMIDAALAEPTTGE